MKPQLTQDRLRHRILPINLKPKKRPPPFGLRPKHIKKFNGQKKIGIQSIR